MQRAGYSNKEHRNSRCVLYAQATVSNLPADDTAASGPFQESGLLDAFKGTDVDMEGIAEKNLDFEREDVSMKFEVGSFRNRNDRLTV